MIFYKSSSGGNDFILLEEHQLSKIHINKRTSFIRDICDRYRGVGGDGLISYRIEKEEIHFSIFNRDGSKAELSGNGMSGLASLLFYTSNSANTVILSTDSGPKKITLLNRKKNIFKLSVEIGEPDFFNIQQFPFLKRNQFEYQLDNISFYPVSVGNPHVVIFIDKNLRESDLEQKGKDIENSVLFPTRTNVEFISNLESSGNKKIVTPFFYERGVGKTELSSTGSAAIFAVLRNLDLTSDNLIIKTGDIITKVSGKNNIYIENSTEIVYKGTYLNEKFSS